MAQLSRDRREYQFKMSRGWSSYPADWQIEDDEPVLQDPEHQRQEFILQSTLLAWQKRTNQEHLLVGCEMACRWDAAFPRVGVGPDVYVVERPPGDETGYIGSLKTWLPGHVPPVLAIEIVSKSRPGKDYKHSPEKHDLLGTFELWVFDPYLFGYTEEQPPAFLQIFQRQTNDVLARLYAGAGPYRSDALDAWVMVVDRQLVIAHDPEGKDRWPTLEEAEQRRAQEERAAKEAALAYAAEQEKRAEEAEQRARNELAEREKAQARIAELEALLAGRS